ncbi:MAG: hypothetical protein ACYCVZ_10950 [Streptosporangiaceae bacterium]
MPIRLLAARVWPLLIVLVIQAVLSARLTWSVGAFQDEAMYMWAGHLEIAHMLHNVAIPDYARFLSGAPTLYPVLAAAADAIGGLVAARLVSLAFMLTCTALLHGVTRRLVNSREAATIAAALFGGLASAQFMGAYATFDAMALMLLTLATWLGIQAAERTGADYLGLLTLTALVLVLADVTKYAAAGFNPVVIAITGCAIWRTRRLRAGIAAGTFISLIAGGLIAGLYTLGGANYQAGVSYTTTNRATGTVPALNVWLEGARWAGLVIALGIIAALIVTFRRTSWPTRVTAWTLAVAGLLAPAGEANLHTVTSLYKHAGYGAWFSAILAGSLLVSLPQIARVTKRPRPHSPSRAYTQAAVAALVILIATTSGTAVAAHRYRGWPAEKQLVAEMRGFERSGGNFLVEDPPVPAYYTMATSQWYQWFSTNAMNFIDPQTGAALTGPAAFASAIQNRYFSVIVLWFGDTITADQQIAADIKKFGTYRLAGSIPYTNLHGGTSHFYFWVPTVQHAEVISARQSASLAPRTSSQSAVEPTPSREVSDWYGA